MPNAGGQWCVGLPRRHLLVKAANLDSPDVASEGKLGRQLRRDGLRIQPEDNVVQYSALLKCGLRP